MRFSHGLVWVVCAVKIPCGVLQALAVHIRGDSLSLLNY